MVLSRTLPALLVLLLSLPLLAAHGQPLLTDWSALDGRSDILLINARILPMTGERGTGEIAEGWLRIGADGTIVALGPMSRQPRIALPTLDCQGMILTPGLINADTELGLSGHPVTGITQEQNDTSERSLPQLRVIDGFNPLDKAVPRVRAAGVTTVYVNPGSGALIAGQGALLKLRPSVAVEDLILKAPAALHCNLGEAPKGTWGGRGGPQTRMGLAAVLRAEFLAGRNWLQGQAKYERELAEYQRKVDAGIAVNKEGEPLDPPSPRERDLKKEAIGQALQGKLPVIFSAHRQDDLLTALRIAEEFELELLLLHATAAWQVLPELKAAGAPLLLGPVRTGPGRFETIAARLDNPRLVSDAGLRFCIQTGGALNSRALAHEAAWAMSAGLSEADALRAITRYPAEIFGVADRIGSLAPGLDADLVLWTKHPFDIATEARYVIIEGKLVSDSAQMPMFPEGPGW